MIGLLRKKAPSKSISLVTLFAMSLQIFAPTYSYALTGGPSQPEVENFTPVGTTDMVDMFTGDFNYNIPLLSVDGYPINLAYTAAPTMDQEASWVGLGWNVNPGAINRNMRGVPDDFQGEELEKYVYMKPNWTGGINAGAKIKLFGINAKKKLSANVSLGVFYNYYKGFGLDLSLSNYQVENKEKPKNAQDTIKLQTFLRNRAIGSIVNMASDIFPESKILLGLIGKCRSNRLSFMAGKDDKFKYDNTNINTNYSVNSYEYSSYTPEVNMEFNQQSYNLGFSFGTASFGIFGSPTLSGSFSFQSLAKQHYNKQTFGYLYNNDKTSNDVILDINREKDGEYVVNKPILPLPINTYDLFNISGQGVAGMVKPFKNGIDVYHDDINSSNNYSGGANLELGLLSDVHTEIHINGQVSNSKSEKWINELSDFLESNKPEEPSKNNKFYERAYFRTIGERVPLDNKSIQNKYYNSIFNPVVKTNFLNIESPSNLIKDGDASIVPSSIISSIFTSLNTPGIKLDNSYSNSSSIYSTNRAKRNQFVSYLTYLDQDAFVQPSIESTKLLISGDPIDKDKIITEKISKNDALRRSNHIGEFSVVKNDGSRYIYGIAAYNNYQREVSFTTASAGTPDVSKGIIAYNSTDETILTDGEHQGFPYKRSDEFYQSTKTKGFAHSYLLTSVLSDDYLDILPRGVGPEDLGNYTKFEYERLWSDYKWRTPYGSKTAQFSEGLRSEIHDNKANFVEGTKEIWYLSVIKSKNQVAVFIKDQTRKDGYDANKAKWSCSLEKIILYDRMEFEKYINPVKNAIPIKTIHFVYDYSLCKGIENTFGTVGNNGKLTLKKVYTTIGISTKVFSVYSFDYEASNTDCNPDYNMANIDRWGGYKKGRGSNLNIPHNMEFPFSEQNQTDANNYAAVWSLRQINLPSGGIIKVNYESDDYAYVQDRRAMQMTQIAGMGNSPAYVNTNGLYSTNHLYFKLPNNLSAQAAKDYVNESMKGIDKICFKVMLQIHTDDNSKNEWINGYADVIGFDVCSNNPYSNGNSYFYVYIRDKKLESFTNSSTTINPIVKAGFNFMKTNMPHVVNPEFADMITDDNNVKAEEVFYKLISAADIMDKLKGIDKKLLDRSDCDKIKRSGNNDIWGWVRLNNPYKDKIGGGYRVSKIVLDDNWTSISSQSNLGNLNQEFGQEFDYTTTEKLGDIDTKVSSGVAAFEPSVGSEENPFKLPIGYERKVRRLPDEEEYIDGPVGESFYPSAIIGYSKVTVKNLGRDLLSTANPPTVIKEFKKHSVGKTVHEFYTARDFPVLVNYTDVNIATINPPMIDLLVYSATVKKVGVSQGFEIILNDMHGKAKGEFVYSASQNIAKEPDGKLISSIEYSYQTEPDNPHKLNNKVTVINAPNQANENTTENKVIAVETEMYADNRSKTDDFYSGAIELNWTTLLTCFGFTIPTILPEASYKTDQFYSSTLMTVKHYYGIQNKTKVYQDGASIDSENLAYDAETGELLVSKTTNEFNEDQFNSVYPAHWKYENGMGQAYKNNGVSLKLSLSSPTDVFVVTDASYIKDNDEILCRYNSKAFMGIIKTISSTNFKIYVQDPNTLTFVPFKSNSGTTELSIKIIRSGNRNMQSNPILSVATLLDPLSTGKLVLNEKKAILDAKAITYTNAKYEYKSFNDRCEIPNDYSDIIPALSYLLDNQQVDLGHGIIEGTSFSYPSGKAILDYPITPNSEILNNENNYTNSFFHQINACNGCYNTSAKLSYEWSQRNGSNPNINEWLRVITFKFPICEVNKNVQSNIQIDFNFFDQEDNDLNTYKDYRIAELNLSSTVSDHKTPVINGCTTNYVIEHTKIKLKKITNSNDVIEIDGICSINLTRCEPDPYEKITLEDHFYKNNQFLAINPVNNWKLGSSFLYKGERDYELNNIRTNNTDLENRAGIKGIYKSYTDFNFNVISSNSERWKKSEETTLIDPYNGVELESKDALGRYRSVIYATNSTQVNNLKRFTVSTNDYLNYKDMETYATKPSLFTENARYCEANVFNFESQDELQPNFPKRVRTDRHYFKQVGENFIVNNDGHTGSQSLKTKGSVSAEFFIAENYNGTEVENSILPYYPTSGKHIVSGWVKVEKPFYSLTQNLPYCKIEVTDDLDNIITTSTQEIYPSGPIINGWQRFIGEFTIPTKASLTAPRSLNKLKLTLNSGTSEQIAYFDDIRIHPYNANSKSYIYDKLQRISAILDENNYATFYYYDHKGELAIVKKETDKGIVTVTETRKQSQKQP